MRTCVVCRRRAAASELIRVRADGSTGPGPGRGAWLCPGPACVADRSTVGALARALRAPFGAVELDRIRASGEFSDRTS
ncbi:MAG: YlxR family protein [Microthrixaceae bacterium]